MKIGFFITARLKSSRLKQKIILPLNGSTIMDQVIKGCKCVKGIEGVVLCTSTNSQDSELYDYAQNHSIKFYAGSEIDVLQRLLDAAKYYGFDAFLSITADNPLHSIYIADLIVDWVKTTPCDFVFTSGVPIGLAPYFINAKALEVAVEMKKNADTEIWGPFVNRPDFFRIGYMNIETELFPKDTRLTCDYLEDYHLFMEIYNKFPVGYNPSIFEISDLIKTGKITLNNTSKVQLGVKKEVLESIAQHFDENKEKGIALAKKINFNLSPGENHLKIIL